MDVLLYVMILFAIIWGVNAAAKSIMSKVHQYNREELAKLKIPFYPIFSYAKFRMSSKEDDEEIDG